MGMERNTIELWKVNPPPFSRSRLNGHASAGEISTGRTEAASLFYILYKPRCCFDDYRVAHTEERRERERERAKSVTVKMMVALTESLPWIHIKLDFILTRREIATRAGSRAVDDGRPLTFVFPFLIGRYRLQWDQLTIAAGIVLYKVRQYYDGRYFNFQLHPSLRAQPNS